MAEGTSIEAAAGESAEPDGARWRTAIAATVVLAAALRLPFLLGFGIDDDEFYTLRNALEAFGTPTPEAVARYPLVFLATRVALELLGVSALALRLVPFVAGVLAPLAVATLGARLVARRTAVFAALLLAVWPWHQYWSGMARYYAPLFLAGCFVMAATWRVVTRPGLDAVAALVLALLVGMAIHPSALLAAAGAAAAPFVPALRARLGPRRVIAGCALAVAAVLAVRFSGLWRTIMRVLSREGGEGSDAVHLVLNLGFNVSLPLVILGAAGAVLLWRRQREPAAFLAATAALPVAMLFALAAAGQGVQGRYAFVALPALLLLAGVAAERLVASAAGHASRAMALLALVAPFGPGLASNLLDGNRHDVAGAAAAVAPLLDGETVLFAEGHGLLGTDLFGYDRREPAGQGDPPFPKFFGEAPAPADALEALAARKGRALFVLPQHQLDAPPSAEGVRFADWLRAHARVRERLFVRRYDSQSNVLLVCETAYGAGS